MALGPVGVRLVRILSLWLGPIQAGGQLLRAIPGKLLKLLLDCADRSRSGLDCFVDLDPFAQIFQNRLQLFHAILFHQELDHQVGFEISELQIQIALGRQKGRAQLANRCQFVL